jgi:hypothetical protein
MEGEGGEDEKVSVTSHGQTGGITAFNVTLNPDAPKAPESGPPLVEVRCGNH